MDLVGRYKLIDYFFTDDYGATRKWIGNQEGQLEYTRDLIVSVKITRESFKKKLTEIEKKKMNLWYSGSYEVLNSKKLIHKIKKSSDVSRVGSELERNYLFRKKILVISGVGLRGNVEMIWEKIKK